MGRYISDWAGSDALVKNVSIKLGTPNVPGETMKMTGAVTEKKDEANEITVEIAGKNTWGNHVTGSVRVVLP